MKETIITRNMAYMSKLPELQNEEDHIMQYFNAGLIADYHDVGRILSIPGTSSSRLLNTLYKKQKIKIVGSDENKRTKRSCSIYSLRKESDSLNEIELNKNELIKSMSEEIESLRRRCHEAEARLEMLKQGKLF